MFGCHTTTTATAATTARGPAGGSGGGVRVKMAGCRGGGEGRSYFIAAVDVIFGGNVALVAVVACRAGVVAMAVVVMEVTVMVFVVVEEEVVV